MASPNHHRKLIQPPSTNNNITTQLPTCLFQCDPQINPTGFCLPECTLFCPSFCTTNELPPQPPANSPYAPQPQPPDHKYHHHQPPLFLPLKISVIFITATLFYTLFKIFRWWRRRTPPPPSPENQENYENDQNDFVDHPIWFIRTTGLQPYVINAIKVVKYEKTEKVVDDGSDCLVCLSEFEENDVVRLLPYCKHVFHVSCIDTWLKSHTNCPLCRGGIVSDNVVKTDVIMEIELRDYNESGESSELRVGENDEDGNSEYSIDVEGDLGVELVNIK